MKIIKNNIDKMNITELNSFINDINKRMEKSYSYYNSYIKDLKLLLYAQKKIKNS